MRTKEEILKHIDEVMKEYVDPKFHKQVTKHQSYTGEMINANRFPIAKVAENKSLRMIQVSH